MTDLDVIVIGTGVAGASVAAGCAAAGLRVAVTDRVPYGGTCAQRGCDPKKVLLAASEVVGRFQALAGRGLEGEVRVAWSELMRRKREFVADVPERTEARLRDAGATRLHGEARFVDADVVEIGGRRLRGGAIVIATGAAPRHLGVPGQDLVVHSDAFMDMDELPPRVIFVGGGYISFEFAALARRAGSDVTIVHRSSRVLKEFDADLTAALVDRYRDLGIRVLLDAPTIEVRRHEDALFLRTPHEDLVADLVVHGAGREPDLEGLDLAAAGVAVGARGVLVDAQLRSTSNPSVFAAGDAAAIGLPLTPAASRQARVVVETILGRPAAYDPRATASVVFSDPPLAQVGMTAAEGASRNDVQIVSTDMSGWFTTRRLGFAHAAAKVVREEASHKLLGAHLLGANAEDVINVFALAVRHGLTTEEVADAVWAYPTASSDIGYLV
ncbi:MAG TPA: NAD(P)/FAD-dependent oxidoreductase [Thermoleophilia bacterium]|nr:NAD(P)/FAD-dependent oxidoreductase [Thermoleophilia bacterium]